MTGPGRAWLRACLVLLALAEAVTGSWQYFAARSFYHFPTVAAGGPFNQHLISDIGGLSLALAVVLGAAALRIRRGLVQAALAGYLVSSVSHLAYHATNLDGLSATDAALLLAGLALQPALALALLVIAVRATAPGGRRRHGEDQARPPGATNPDPARTVT